MCSSDLRKIADLFSRTNAGRMNNLVAEIETAASGGNDRCGRPVRHDWRAAQMLAALHDDRFKAQRDTATTTNNTAVVMLAGGEDQLRKLVGMWSGEAKQLQPAVEQPKIPATAQDDKLIDG